jgi:hypothetical protein
MNDFLDNLSKTVNETAKKAMKASGNFLELTKTSLSIKFDEAKRDSFFREIGKIVYSEYKGAPEGASEEILEFCACIDEIENTIKFQKTKAAAIKNKKYCSDCGVILEKSVNYCYSCGAKQPEIEQEDEEESAENCWCADGACSASENSDEENGCCADEACSCGDEDGEEE